MNIGIDIDDTLSQLYMLAKEELKNYMIEKNFNYKVINENPYHFTDIYDWSKQEKDDFWWEKYLTIINNAQPQENVSQVTKQLKADGHNIYIITARSHQFHHDPYQESYDWLQKNNIYFDELIVNCADKSQICKEKQIDVLIDDHPTNVEVVLNAGINSWLFSAVHNLNYNNENVKRFNNWNEIYESIKQINI